MWIRVWALGGSDFANRRVGRSESDPGHTCGSHFADWRPGWIGAHVDSGLIPRWYLKKAVYLGGDGGLWVCVCVCLCVCNFDCPIYLAVTVKYDISRSVHLVYKMCYTTTYLKLSSYSLHKLPRSVTFQAWNLFILCVSSHIRSCNCQR